MENHPQGESQEFPVPPYDLLGAGVEGFDVESRVRGCPLVWESGRGEVWAEFGAFDRGGTEGGEYQALIGSQPLTFPSPCGRGVRGEGERAQHAVTLRVAMSGFPILTYGIGHVRRAPTR